MKKAIVTGGLGFIGSNLIEILLNKKFFVDILLPDNLAVVKSIIQLQTDKKKLLN